MPLEPAPVVRIRWPSCVTVTLPPLPLAPPLPPTLTENFVKRETQSPVMNGMPVGWLVRPLSPPPLPPPPPMLAAWMPSAPAPLVVTILSLLPEDSRPVQTLSLLPFGDKVHHALSYAVLGFIPVLHEKGRTAAALVAVAVTLGWVIEVVQGYTGRTPDVADGIADLVGITAGVLIGLAFRSR